MSIESIDLRRELAKRFFRLALPMNLVLLGLVGTLFVVLLGPAAQAGGLPLSTGLIAVLLSMLVLAFALTLAGAEYLRCRRQAGSLIVLDSFGATKTAELKNQFAKLGTGKSALVIDAASDGFLAARNLVGVNVLPAVGANVYDILKHDTLVLTRAAVESLEARFNG